MMATIALRRRATFNIERSREQGPHAIKQNIWLKPSLISETFKKRSKAVGTELKQRAEEASLPHEQ
jgi:hypothetical protein